MENATCELTVHSVHSAVDIFRVQHRLWQRWSNYFKIMIITFQRLFSVAKSRGFLREAVTQTLWRETSQPTTSRSIQFHALRVELHLALAAALFRFPPVIISPRGKTINSQIEHSALVASEFQPMLIANVHLLPLLKLLLSAEDAAVREVIEASKS